MSSSSSSEESSVEIPEVPYLDKVEFPYKEPRTIEDYTKFFDSLFNTNFFDEEQQIMKAYCSVLETSPPEALQSISRDERMEIFLYACIARADVSIKQLIDLYAPIESKNFFPVDSYYSLGFSVAKKQTFCRTSSSGFL